MGHVLVNDPEPLVVGGEDERIAQLAQRLQRGQRVQGFFGTVDCIGRVSAERRCGRRFISNRDAEIGECQAAGRFRRHRRAQREAGCVRGGRIGVGLRMLPRREDRVARRPRHGAYVQQQRRAGMRRGGQRTGETGRRPRGHQRSSHGVADEVVYEPRLPEAHLGFGRMHIHIDLLRRHLQEEQHHRERGWRNDIAVGLSQRMQHHPVAHQAMVDEDVDRVAVQLLQLRLGDEPRNAQKSGVGRRVILLALPGRRLGQAGAREVHLRRGREHQRCRVAAKDLEQPVAGRGHRRRDQQRLGRRMQFKVPLRMRQRIVRHQRGNVGQLGLLGLEEFAPRRRVVEQVADRDGGARRRAGIFHAQYFAAGDLDLRARVFVRGMGFQRQTRDAGNRRQRLAAEAERPDLQQIV